VVRLAHYPHDNAFIEACDELGILVYGEAPTWIDFGGEKTKERDVNNQPNPKAFPAVIPLEKPTDRPLSAAMARMYDVWNPHEDRANPFFSNFRYSRLTGIPQEQDLSGGALLSRREALLSRRDPSTVIKVGETYYVWYTRRDTAFPPVGSRHPELQTDLVPAVDWDLADIWYATSRDGFHWQERGVAVPRAPRGQYGDRSLTTPSVLVYRGKYYLYYQAWTGRWARNDCVGVSMAWAESPDGPWTRLDRTVVSRGERDEWDGCAIHDPFPLVYRGKIWLYYKGAPLDKSDRALIRAQGAAIAGDPAGPFEKCPLNPLINSGHETCLYPYREGIAAIVTDDGAEKNTVQYAPDGLNFEVKAHLQLPPRAAGPFCPDLFAGNGDGRGITWGLCHIHPRGSGGHGGLILARFDCDLSRDVDRPDFKRNNPHFDERTYFQHQMALPDGWKNEILAQQAALDRETM
jgi:hypothetical protein